MDQRKIEKQQVDCGSYILSSAKSCWLSLSKTQGFWNAYYVITPLIHDCLQIFVFEPVACTDLNKKDGQS